MGKQKKFYRTKSAAQKKRRKGERVVSYMGGYQLSKR